MSTTDTATTTDTLETSETTETKPATRAETNDDRRAETRRETRSEKRPNGGDPRQRELRDPKARRADDDVPSNRVKEPEDWVTGDERMTGAQASYLKTLCEEAGEEFDPGLTKARASKEIDRLQDETGRGPGSAPDDSSGS